MDLNVRPIILEKSAIFPDDFFALCPVLFISLLNRLVISVALPSGIIRTLCSIT